MSRSSSLLRVALIVGLAVSAAVLITSLPPLFADPTDGQVRQTGIAGGVTLVLVVAALRGRPRAWRD